MIAPALRLASFILLFNISAVQAQQFYAGSTSVNITPKLPAALQGQFHLRIGDSVQSPLTANAIAFETRSAAAKDTAVFVACDLTFITAELSTAVREQVARMLPGFNISKVIVTATHTHTVPVYGKGTPTYPIPENVLQPAQYFDSLSVWIANAAVSAWKKRQPATISWGLGKAVVGYNRRASYADGRAVIYGNTNTPDFMNIEGYEDHDLNALYIQSKAGKLIAVCLDVPCPSQEVEGNSAVNADYWHDVRIALHKRWGKELTIVGWAGGSGDQSPHLLYRAAAENRMIQLAGRTRMQEIGHRIDQAAAETYSVVRKEAHAEVPFTHLVTTINLPPRKVTEDEYVKAKTMADTLRKQIEGNQHFRELHQAEMLWHQDVVDRYMDQKKNPDSMIRSEIHAIRLGDIAIITNDFELFTDYSIRIQARSKALQTFVVQCASGYHIYLPTEKAVKGGSYSAIVHSCLVGPEGGKILVDESVKLINGLF